MKLVRWVSDNILLVLTLFLLAFIPLYPKLPVIGVDRTWVYVRIEDFLIVFTCIVFFIQLLRKKATVKTPLTIPIIIFWVIGGIATFGAILFLFKDIANVFPHVAILHYLRRIEYISLFFVGYAAIRHKKLIPFVPITLSIILLFVVLYGFGQRIFPENFPAFLTMNEEFAKGIPLKLSALARIPSTFAGHYDLAAYLVLLIPLMVSMVFGFRNRFAKLAFASMGILGLILLLMTASRVSFGVYLVTISFLFLILKKKIFIIPVIILSLLVLTLFQGISQRFGGTISQVDVVVDARTGKAIGIAKEVIEPTSKEKKIVIEDIQSTGENLPQGSGYINLPTQDEAKTTTEITYKRAQIRAGTQSAEITNLQGDFVIKKVLAYDVSFTTRFQGQWPRAFEAFNRNILLGSGYSSISLATDSDYIRMLGETGLLGLFAFLFIFLIFGITVRKLLPDITDKVSRYFVLGVVAGVFGVGLNAFLIDVFEASKVAFVLWLLMGITLGILTLYQKRAIDYAAEIKKVLLSIPAFGVYFLLLTFAFFFMTLNNYFVGDDFTWLRWAADCKKVITENGGEVCQSLQEAFITYFTDAQGFFYRPGTKIYFFFMYALSGLNQVPYHIVSVLLHFVATVFVFLISLRLLKNKLFAFIAGVIFLVLSGHSESIFWIAATGHLIASVLMLASFYLYMLWREEKKVLFMIVSLITAFTSSFFHEFGIVTPLLIIVYDVIMEQRPSIQYLKTKWYWLLYLLLIPSYLLLRYNAESHWLNGDYSYNILKFPFNAVGNTVGYLGIALFGNNFMHVYEMVRMNLRDNIGLSLLLGIVSIVIIIRGGIFIQKKLRKEVFRIIIFSLSFFVITLLPFLGLGNITLRYVYLPSVGIAILLAVILQQLYRVLPKVVGIALIVISVGIFSLYHIQELYKTNKDWQKAGSVTSNLLLSLNNTFPKDAQTSLQDPVFYFVNVPIRTGDAWIFPVGLPDALWLTFQDKNLTVHTDKPLDAALGYAEASTSARVFEFQKDGTAEEIIVTREIVPQKK